MQTHSFMTSYTSYARRLPLWKHAASILLEDFVHWWIIYPALCCILEKGIALHCVSSLLFALGHLGRRPMEAVYEPSFWMRKFPAMLLMGYLYACMNEIGRLYVTILHAIVNITCFMVLSRICKPEQPGDWFLMMAAQQRKYPRPKPAPMTEKPIAERKDFEQMLERIVAEELAKREVSNK